MKTPVTIEYGTEGAPLMIADAKAWAQWTGSEHDGSPITVEYMSDNFKDLPKDLKVTKSPGMQTKKFATAAEAEAFEKKLLPALIKLNPAIDDPPTYPNSSHSYIGENDEERFYSMEREQGSMFKTFAIEGKYTNSVSVATFDKASKAKGCLISTYGSTGTILADTDAGIVVIAIPYDETGNTPKVKKAFPALLDAKVRAKAKPKAIGKIELDGRVIVYDASFSHGELAKLNWKGQPFLKGVASSFEKSSDGPLKYPDRREPGGAFLALPAGSYTAYSQEQTSLSGTDLQVLWLVRE
jgi:hypothetical protein